MLYLWCWGPAWRSALALAGESDDASAALVAEALACDAEVIPFLVDGVELPPKEQLPITFQPLADRFSVRLPSDGWEAVLDEFAERFVPHLKRQILAGPPPAAALPAARGALGWLGAKMAEIMDKLTPSGAAHLPDADQGEPAAPASTPAPAPEAEPVLLGASAPRGVKPDDEFTARLVAYEKPLEQEIRQLLKQLSPSVEPVLGVQQCRWQHGARVTVKLSAKGLSIDPAEQAFVWNGGRALLEFDVAVPREMPESRVVLKFDVAVEGVVIARLRLDLEISNKPEAGISHTEGVEPAKSAFASYSSKDRLRVLDRVASVQRSAGLDVFLDCLDLHPGEKWKPRLDKEIRRRDLFLLFWSSNAQASKWVNWELDTALREKGEHALQVHPLEPDVAPPPGLEDLHVGDAVMWVRRGYDASQEKRG